MRIAYLTSQYPATSHTFIRREVTALRALGVDVQTFSIRAPADAELIAVQDQEEAASTFTLLTQPLASYLRRHFAELLSRPLAYAHTLVLALQHRPPGIRAMLLSLAHFGEAIMLSFELRRRGIDHLHNHFANSGASVGLLASRNAGLPWSFTIHGISEFDYPAGLLLPEKVAAASFVACVSYFGRAQAYRLLDREQWGKLKIVRCGLELDQLPTPKPRMRGPQFIAVGRLSSEKGISGLLEALSNVAADIRPQLLIVGDGPMRGELDQLVDLLGLGDWVRFAGRLPEAETLAAIAQSDVLVLPSFMEGLPIVLMEAMAMGKPVIATRVAGIPELVEDGVNGLLFTPSDWHQLAEKIAKLAKDEALREELGSAGPRSIAREFNVRRSAERLRDLLGAVQSVARSSEHRIAPAGSTSAASTERR